MADLPFPEPEFLAKNARGAVNLSEEVVLKLGNPLNDVHHFFNSNQNDQNITVLLCPIMLPPCMDLRRAQPIPSGLLMQKVHDPS